jgi:hypothetical protein
MIIAEWIANLLVFGIAVIIWAIGVHLVSLLIIMFKEWIDNLIGGE